MDHSLELLIKRMAPPSAPRFSNVNWEKAESAVELAYPRTFKEFVSKYGGSVWFDNLCPFFPVIDSDADANAFIQRVKAKLAPLEANMYDEGKAKN